MDLDKVTRNIENSGFLKHEDEFEGIIEYYLLPCTIIYQIGLGVGKHGINHIRINKKEDTIQFNQRNNKNGEIFSMTKTDSSNLKWFGLNETHYNPPVF